MEEKKKKRSKWVKKRHSVVISLLKPPLGLYTKAKYKIKLEKFKNYDGRQYFIISYNKVTVIGTAASRVYFHLKAEAVRMGE